MDFDARGIPLYGLYDAGSTAKHISASSVQQIAWMLITRGADPNTLSRSHAIATPLNVALGICLYAGMNNLTLY